MARNRKREFSEGEGLNPKDLGFYPDDGEERMPAWAQKISQEKEERPAVSNVCGPRREEKNEEIKAPDDEMDTPLPEAAPEIPEAPDPDAPLTGDAPELPRYERMEEPVSKEEEEAGESRERIVQLRAEKDETETDAPREAIRVEGNAFRRRQTGKEEETESPPAAKKGKSAKGKGKGKDKRKNRKKKNATREEEQAGFIRMMMIILLCGGLFLMVLVMVVSNFVSLPILSVPQRVVTGVVSPVQSAFSSLTDAVVGYLRKLKIRGNLEYEYEQLRARLDEYETDVAMMEELRRENQSLQALVYEHQQPTHHAMNPIGAQVIGKVGNNYFSTLTLNVGSDSGVADYMAVVSDGGLVGVTYNVRANQCDVRCVIDSDCTVAGLVQSSRDQGSVKGTLGTNGEPMCRMYYLPDNSLPRPGDVVVTSGVGLEFPKGIPIGTIRESTRGMEDNKSYVVLEPIADFQHLEYVTVYRYRPSYAESAQARINASQNIRLEPLVTAQPVPTFDLGSMSDMFSSALMSPAPSNVTPAPTPVPTATPRLTPTPDPRATNPPPNLEYIPGGNYGESPSPSPRPTFTPSPSPVPTPDPGGLTVEE